MVVSTKSFLLNAALAPIVVLDETVLGVTVFSRHGLELNTGTDYTAPLNDYQYVVLHNEDENSPNTIWNKGDDRCPAATKD
ncbi:hypothetical protein ACHAP8_008893 [Fusarium lateritium]